MEFLVEIESCWPPDGDAAQKAELAKGEAEFFPWLAIEVRPLAAHPNDPQKL